MKKLLAVLTAIVAGVSALFSQTVVTTDAEIRAAMQNDGVTIRVDADIDLSNSTLSIPAGNTVTLDLNGHKLDRKLTKRGEGGGQVITVRQGATLNLSNGTLAGGWGGAGGALVNEGGTVELTDVTVTNNVADDRGGGICNRDGGVLTMTGGAITNNHSNDKSGAKGGGGFFNEENATATLTNVIITGNEAKVCGGGGICNFGTLTLDGCTIQNNAAITNGGGIWQEGTLNVQGANIVTGNTTVDNKPNNLFLKTGALLTVTGSLAGSTILVDMESGTGTLTSGYNTHNSGVDPATFFQSEWPDIIAVTLENNEVQLGSSLAEGDYYYIDNHWSDGKLTYETKILHPGEYTLLTPAYHEDTDLFLSGNYVVVTNDKGYKCHYDGIAYVTANTKIILCDGAKLEIEGCLLVAQNEVVLDVYGQVNNTGVLQTHGDITHYGENYPGIGSGKDDVTDMYFHGGHIIAKGEYSYAGIGGGYTGNNYSRMFFYNANVEATGGSGGPGIGTWHFANEFDNTHVYIYGGTIKAYGGDGGAFGAGIGGGNDSYGLRLYVYGGEVYAYGAGNAAGIGGGWNGGGGWVEVYGGLVKAYGGDNGAGIGSGSKPFLQDEPAQAGGLKVYGGEVYAYGGVDAAGVGGGEDCYGGVVEVYGGYLYAEGNDNGAGIGGGEDGDGGWVTINGGTVVAKTTGTDEGSRAIGPGDGSDDYNTLDIGDDMMVISERKFTAAERKNACWYRTNVRVEVCDHSDGFTYTVDGTGPNDHHISHCPYCLHTDTALHTFDANGVCTVCGVHNTAYAAKLYMPVAQPTGSFDGQSYGLTHTHLVVPDSAFLLPMATLKVPGYEFIGWEATTEPTEDSYISPYTTTAENLYKVGAKYTVTGNICFVARYRVADVTLYDDEQNGVTLNEYNGMKVSKVILSGRVFNKNNTWQPLSLPFDLSAEELAASPLAGAELKQLDLEGWYQPNALASAHQTGYDLPAETLYLFFKDTTAIEAGKPYVIRWASGDAVENPVFENVTITNRTASVPAPYFSFVSLYSPKTYAEERTDVVYLGANNTFLQPDGLTPATIGSCRAYFKLSKLYLQQATTKPLTIITNLSGAVVPTDIEEIPYPAKVNNGEAYKFLRNGILFIERNGVIYNVLGAQVK